MTTFTELKNTYKVFKMGNDLFNIKQDMGDLIRTNKLKQTTVQLKTEHVDKLNALADKYNVSTSVLLRHILDNYFNNN